MFLFHKIRLALNVAPEGLLWHLRRSGPRVALHNVMLNQIQHLFIKGMPGQARHDWNGHCYTFSWKSLNSGHPEYNEYTKKYINLRSKSETLTNHQLMQFNSILIVLPILTVLMFDLGLSLRISDFIEIFRKPKAMVAGLFGQLVLLPLIALAIGTVFRLEPEFFIGLMLIACCPGGSSSNIFSKIAKGDVALSVSMTAFSSIITLFTLPLIMQITTAHAGETVGITLPVGNLLKQNLFTMLLPIVAGICIRRWAENASLKIDKVLSKCAFPALMLLAGIFFIQNKAVIVTRFATLGMATGGLILGSILAAAAICLILRLQRTERRTIVIEVGMQNAAQAIAVATSPIVFNNPVIATPAIIYALLMNVVLLTYVAVASRR